jgi:hypothetical protein
MNTRFAGRPNEGTSPLDCEPDDGFSKIPKIIPKYWNVREDCESRGLRKGVRIRYDLQVVEPQSNKIR